MPTTPTQEDIVTEVDMEARTVTVTIAAGAMNYITQTENAFRDALVYGTGAAMIANPPLQNHQNDNYFNVQPNQYPIWAGTVADNQLNINTIMQAATQVRQQRTLQMPEFQMPTFGLQTFHKEEAKPKFLVGQVIKVNTDTWLDDGIAKGTKVRVIRNTGMYKVIVLEGDRKGLDIRLDEEDLTAAIKKRNLPDWF